MRFRERHWFKRRRAKLVETDATSMPDTSSFLRASNGRLDYASALHALNELDLSPQELALAKRDIRNAALRRVIDSV